MHEYAWMCIFLKTTFLSISDDFEHFGLFSPTYVNFLNQISELLETENSL